MNARNPLAISPLLSQVRSNDHPSTLELIDRLCECLRKEDLTYCHWKSNNALDRSASGDNDLDLLVRRTDVQRFTEILYGLGFKLALAPPAMHLPGVLDYYGHDESTGRLVHVHAHYQLILGHDRTKNYRLPIEEPFLASVTQNDLFKIPSPEFEFIVFVIRMIIKYSTWDAIIARQGTLPDGERREFEYLHPRTDRTQLHDQLRKHLPSIDSALFDACVQSLQPNCSAWTRMHVGRRLQKELRPFARRSQAIDSYLKIERRIVRGIRRRLRRLPKKRFAHAGVTIALVGGDGAGKSTAIQELYDWVSKDFEAIRVHLGKPPWSWTTYSVRGALKIARLLRSSLARNSTHRGDIDQKSPVVPRYSRVLWSVCAARDRYRLYVKTRRFATNGGLVICDRYPLEQIKLMDGPQVEQIIKADEMNSVVKLLARLEKKYYRPITPPEILIVLKVDPEIAVRRKTDENANSVRVRSTEIWELDWQQTEIMVVDASQSKEQVLSELKSYIWSIL